MTTLQDAKAKDLMQRTVITLPADAPIAEAVAAFEDDHITGVPVVDAAGTVVGMLSARDVTRTEHLGEGRIQVQRGDFTMSGGGDERGDEPDAAAYGKEDYSAELLGRETVGDWMNQKVISVGPGASLREVCTLLDEQGIHRVVVLERGRLAGIVTSTDVVRFLARHL